MGVGEREVHTYILIVYEIESASNSFFLPLCQLWWVRNLPAYGLFVFRALWGDNRGTWRWWDWERGCHGGKTKNWTEAFAREMTWEPVISFWATQKWHLVRSIHSILILLELEGLKNLEPIAANSQPWILLSPETELHAAPSFTYAFGKHPECSQFGHGKAEL